MIEKVDLKTIQASNEPLHDIRRLMYKINELVEASNRQDRAIAYILRETYNSDLHKALPQDEDYKYWEELKRNG